MFWAYHLEIEEFYQIQRPLFSASVFQLLRMILNSSKQKICHRFMNAADLVRTRVHNRLDLSAELRDNNWGSAFLSAAHSDLRDRAIHYLIGRQMLSVAWGKLLTVADTKPLSLGNRKRNRDSKSPRERLRSHICKRSSH